MVSFFFESIAFRVGDREEESPEDDGDAGLSGGASPEGSEEKERTGEAAACAVEKVSVRRPPKEGKARRGWRGDDARPNDDEEDEEDEDEEDEGGSLKRGDDRRRFARGLTQRNLASIIGRRVCVCV